MEEVRTVTGSLDRDLSREGHAGGVGGWGVRSTLPDSVTVNAREQLQLLESRTS